jgi:hypothetical protein
MIMARRLTGRCQSYAVVEITYIGGLIRNEVQCLCDFDIVLLEHTVVNVHGIQRVSGHRAN